MGKRKSYKKPVLKEYGPIEQVTLASGQTGHDGAIKIDQRREPQIMTGQGGTGGGGTGGGGIGGGTSMGMAG